MPVRDFPPRLRSAAYDSDVIQNWLDQLTERQNIDAQQELTSVASGDELLVFDVSETGHVKTKKATINTIRGGGIVSVKDFGAVGDGVTNDTAAIILAVAGGGLVYFPPGTYRVTSPVTITAACRLIGAGPGKTKILVDLPDSGGKAFILTADDVSVEGIEFTGTGVTGTLTGNLYALFGGNGSTKYYNHTYRNLKFSDLSRSDDLTETSNLLVHHAMYVDNVDNVLIYDVDVDTASGAGLFARDIVGLTFQNFSLVDCQWYPINLESGIESFYIGKGRIDCQLASGVYWGGGINLMSNIGETRNKQGLIERIEFTGNYSYGAVIRLLSSEDITVRDFTIKDWDVGSWGVNPDTSAVRVETRGTSTAAQNGPCHNIRIYNYEIEAPASTASHRGIYVGNQFQTTRTPATDIFVERGRLLSTDTSSYFSEGIIFHGQDGGIEGVRVYDNHVTTVAKSSPTVGGALGFVGNDADGGVTDVWIGGNDLEDLDTPSSSVQVGISVGAYTDRLYNTSPNRVDNYYYGVRTFTNSGPTLDRLDDQSFGTMGSANTLFNVNLSYFGRSLGGSIAWDPGSIADGDSETKSLTVTGAAIGDFVDASFSLDLQDLGISAYVSATNTVEIVLQNNTGSARDLSSGTAYVQVRKRGSAA